MQYLMEAPHYELKKYSGDERYSRDGSVFVGAPRKHPYDIHKLILIQDPFGSDPSFFEFSIRDILHVEDMPNIVNESGKSLKLVRIWIRKGSLGLSYRPFRVD